MTLFGKLARLTAYYTTLSADNTIQITLNDKVCLAPVFRSVDRQILTGAAPLSKTETWLHRVQSDERHFEIYIFFY